MQLPARPKITLLAPKEMMPGTSVILTVRLDSPRATPIDFVDLFVVASESRDETRTELLRVGARLRGKGKLEKGRTELECRVDLPPQMPPSFEGRGVWIHHEARVHVSVPYWPDAHGAFKLHVRPPPREPTIAGPLLFSSHAGGAPSKGPYAELSLASRSAAAGEVLSGAIALYNVTACRYDEVKVILSQRQGRQPGPSWSIDVPVPSLVEGRPLPFAMRIPAVPPSMRIPAQATLPLEFSYELVVTAHAGWTELLRMPVPIDIVPDTVGSTGRERAAPAVGEERVRLIWQKVAAEEGMRLDGEALHGEVGGVSFSVRRELGPGPARLIGEVLHPSLGLGLRSLPKRLRLGRAVLGTRVPHFDRAHSFEARCDAQAAPFLAMMGARAWQLVSTRGGLEELTDERTALFWIDSGTTEASIRGVTVASRELASIVVELLRAVPLPPPLKEDDWRAMAERLGTVPQVGTGLVTWEDADARIAVRPLFDERGHVHAVRIARRESSALDVRAPLTVTHAEGLGSLTSDARRVGAAILARGVELHIGEEDLAVTGRLDTHWTSDELPPRIEETVTLLARLAAALRPERGPFR